MYMTGKEELFEVLNHEFDLAKACSGWGSRYLGFEPIDIITNTTLLTPNTIYKTLRALLLCGYLSRPYRKTYFVINRIPEDLTCKELERQARQVLEGRRKNGTPPISEDYNYKNKKR